LWWTNWWYLLSIFNGSIVIFTCNVLFDNGKTFSEVKKTSDFMAFTSITNIGSYTYINWNQLIDLLVIFAWCFQLKNCNIYFQYVIGQCRHIFKSQNNLIFIQLWPSPALQVWVEVFLVFFLLQELKLLQQKNTFHLNNY